MDSKNVSSDEHRRAGVLTRWPSRFARFLGVFKAKKPVRKEVLKELKRPKEPKRSKEPKKPKLGELKVRFKEVNRRYLSGKILSLPEELEEIRLGLAQRPRANTRLNDDLPALSVRIEDDRMLLCSGPALPVRRAIPSYEPDPKCIFYFINSAVPMASNGYSTRSHSVLKALRREGWNAIGIVRPGFFVNKRGESNTAPEDLPPSSYEYEGVPYLWRPDFEGNESKITKSTYHRQCADSIIAHAMIHRPALIHAASNHTIGIAGAIAARELGIPMVYEVRGLWELTKASRVPGYDQTDQFALHAALEAHAARAADATFAITGAVADILAERGVERTKMEILSNGVDVEAFQPMAKDQELAAALGVTDKIVIGYAGSITEYEGLELLLEAATGLPAEVRKQIHIVIVGDGPHFETLRAAVEKAREAVSITLVGRVAFSEVRKFYSIFDVAALPRRKCLLCDTVSPLKPFELMAMEKAVIASDVNALAEIVNHNVTGLLHRADDVDSLRAALDRLISDPVLRTKLGQTGRCWVMEERTWAAAAKRVGAAYDRLLRVLPHTLGTTD